MAVVAEKAHAVLGPSGWHTWGTCPGSVPLSDGIVEQPSKYAKEGTAAHALLEQCLTEERDAEDFIGQSFEVEGDSFTVDNEMADAVNSAIEIVRSYMDEGAILQVEQTVPLTFMTGEPDAEGTCDIAIIAEGGTKLVIADFKYGKGVQVYASGKEPWITNDGNMLDTPNGQLAMYALGWLQKYATLYEDVTDIKLVVIQPRIEWHDEYDLSLEALRAFEDVIRSAAGQVELNRQVYAEGNDLDLVPTEKGCKFCKAKHVCPALREHVSNSLALVAEPSKVEQFEDLTLPKQAAAIAVRPEISSERLAEFMRAIPLIEEAIKAATAETERRLFAGEAVPGFYLGVGRKGNRAWAPGAEEELKKRLGSKAFVKKVIGVPDAEKAFKAKPRTWAKIAPLIVQADGKPSVCRDGDKNPPFQIVSAVEEFQNLDAQPDLAALMA